VELAEEGGDRMTHQNEPAAQAYFARHAVGSLVRGRVVDVQPFGVFVELADGVHGLVHESEYTDRPEVGTTVEAQILAMDPARARLSLRPV
jgi:ribosomal protein S1